MRGNVPFQRIHNSLSLKASSPQVHMLCSTAFLGSSDFRGLMKCAYQIGSSCKRFRR